MKKLLVAGLFISASFNAFSQAFPGDIIAEFYMEEMSIPKGWTLSYKGEENKIQVFTMSRDLDAYPQTAMRQPIDQMRRLMCGDDALKDMISQGVKVKVDARDKIDGKVKGTLSHVFRRSGTSYCMTGRRVLNPALASVSPTDLA